MIKKANSRKFIQLSLIFLFSLTQLQCANFLEPMTPKDTNEAYLYAARKKIDTGDYLEAIDDLLLLEADFAADNDVRVTFASAYAGACGMEFIPFFSNISSANITPPNTFFKFLRGSFTNKATTPSYCTLAENKLKEIGATEALRLAAMGGSKEVNMLMAILAMAKIGSVLRTASDVDGVNSLGDGSTDAGFNACTNDNSNITNDEVLEVATGFGLFIENLTSLLGSGSDAETALNGVSLILTAICDLTPSTKCIIRNTSEVAPADLTEFVDTYRDLLRTDTLGIGSCNALDPDTCCP